MPAALAKDVLDGLGGPPDPFLVNAGRYAVASACVSHACPVKGLFWYDTQSGTGVGASYDDGELRLGSKGTAASAFPAPAQGAVRGWLTEQGLKLVSVTFIGADGKAVSMPVDPFAPPPRFQPPEGGPSFDCAKASTKVEHAICTTPVVAKRDLEMALLVREMKLGYDTLDSRKKLLVFQRAWLKQRDAECSPASDIGSCLVGQYAAQQQRLMHWLPR
ncbi:lysozyme inhibitor LprI family protein [Pseudoduganella violaceinigra]|uniref:lysozyme inhibitor LprI family protein n=1 Tax=Pseudoduganella violaceinigra TaxID=246602 RepID=UPI00137747D9|nr:lysozyme inhibitor LprI family protein [Pseudoduganella violaceinigra]